MKITEEYGSPVLITTDERGWDYKWRLSKSECGGFQIMLSANTATVLEIVPTAANCVTIKPLDHKQELHIGRDDKRDCRKVPCVYRKGGNCTEPQLVYPLKPECPDELHEVCEYREAINRYDKDFYDPDEWCGVCGQSMEDCEKKGCLR